MVTGKAIRCIVYVGCEEFVWLLAMLSDASVCWVLGVCVVNG